MTRMDALADALVEELARAVEDAYDDVIDATDPEAADEMAADARRRVRAILARALPDVARAALEAFLAVPAAAPDERVAIAEGGRREADLARAAEELRAALAAAVKELRTYATEDDVEQGFGMGCRSDPFGSIQPVVERAEAAIRSADAALATRRGARG